MSSSICDRAGDNTSGPADAPDESIYYNRDVTNRILVVDDSRLMRSLICESLADMPDVEIDQAASAAEAKTVVAAAGGRHVLALLDLVLPDAMEGQIVPLITRMGIPSVVFTSEVNEQTRRDCIRGGVIDYIVKSDARAIQEISTLVRRVLANRSVAVLAVDDSPAIRAHYERLLTNYRFVVHTAANGQEALDVFAAHPEIQLIITDYDMPVMDGYTLIQELRARRDNASLAIIGCTGRNDAVVTARLLKAGADDFISKPFWNEEFFRRIMRSVENLERIRRLNELNETKDRFVGMAAHDLRAPLANTISVMELLLEGHVGTVTKEQEHLLQLVNEGSHGMMTLITDLLDVGAIESGSLRLALGNIDIVEVLRKQIIFQGAAAERKGVTVTLAPANAGPPEEVVLYADPGALAQIVSNVLSNAIKYTPRNSTVQVALVRDDESGTGGFSISDEGAGIPEEERDKLFRSFSRLSTRPTAGESSHGLGLAIVKRLADVQNGTISYEPGEVGGSRFTVLLPLADATKEGGEPSRPSP